MYISQFPLFTSKETPADAEVISHQLMLRSGMLQKVASGIYTWLPLGLRTLRKVEAIVREEMDASGAIEVCMPTIQPAELWKESTRWDNYGAELLRIVDRHQRDFVYGPTHEEVITDIARTRLTSYRQLPIHFYQIQTKFRDEIRPRFGAMRAREFVMKDGYSFHIDEASLDETYQTMYQTYSAILSRLQLEFRAVLADTGAIGGKASHEFHVLAASGEDDIAFSADGRYAANVELAPCPANLPRTPGKESRRTLETPGIRTIEALAAKLEVPATRCLKAIFVRGSNDNMVALFLRGDHRLNAVKAAKHPQIASPLTFATEEDIHATVGCHVGSLGPVDLDLPILVDHSAAAMSDFICGANRDDAHFAGVNWDTDVPNYELADLRNIEAGDPVPEDAPDASSKDKNTVMIKRGIEVGHIFKLGEKYSAMLKAQVLNQQGKLQNMLMGCYGIGISRIVAATIEQNHDDQGIVWPYTTAPFTAFIAPIGYHHTESVSIAARQIHQSLEAQDIEVLLDDRDIRIGEMLSDAELIGIPYQIIIGKRNLDKAQVEIKARKTKETTLVPIDQCSQFLKDKLSS